MSCHLFLYGTSCIFCTKLQWLSLTAGYVKLQLPASLPVACVTIEITCQMPSSCQYRYDSLWLCLNSEVILLTTSLIRINGNWWFHTDSLQNKCQTANPDRQNLGRSGRLSSFTIYKFWQNCGLASFRSYFEDCTDDFDYNKSLYLRKLTTWFYMPDDVPCTLGAFMTVSVKLQLLSLRWNVWCHNGGN